MERVAKFGERLSSLVLPPRIAIGIPLSFALQDPDPWRCVIFRSMPSMPSKTARSISFTSMLYTTMTA